MTGVTGVKGLPALLRQKADADCGVAFGGITSKIKGNSFRPEGRVTFVVAKVTKTVGS